VLRRQPWRLIDGGFKNCQVMHRSITGVCGTAHRWLLLLGHRGRQVLRAWPPGRYPGRAAGGRPSLG